MMEVILVYAEHNINMGDYSPWKAYPAKTTRDKQIKEDVEKEFGPGANYATFFINVENT